MKTLKEIRAPKIKKGLRDKKGKLHTVDMKLDGSKLSFRVTDEFGSFKTVNAKGLARMFEGTDVEKFIEEARGYGKKPVSMMTPAEKKKDAERRKEYNAYQKGKREDVKEQNCGCGKTPCETYGDVDEAMNPKDKAKRLKMIKKAVERINKNNAEKAKKDALRMMKDSGMFDESVEINEDYAQDLDLAQKNVARLAKQEKGQEKKDYMAVARALNQGNLGAVKKVIKSISTDEIRADILNILVGYNDLIAKMYPKSVDAKGRLKTPMNVSKMINEDVELDESVEITEGKQSYVDQMRDIVAKKSAKKINGVMVDMFTASAVVKVYDAINDTNKAKMDKMTVPAMANVAFKLMKK